MVKCVFCGRDEDAHKGIHYIKNDGSVNYFCSSKCRKNVNHLGRDKRKIKWTTFYKEGLAKSIVKREAAAEAAKNVK